jgi:hypothetical protein
VTKIPSKLRALTLAAACGVTSTLAAAVPAVHYDFEHAAPGDVTRELDQGTSGTTLWLVNGGAAMRVADGAWAGSSTSIQTGQMAGANNDWKAGVYDRPGVATLSGFASATGVTIMGYVKPTGTNPSPNTNTANANDFFNAVGLMGVLRGDSNGHDVRALLEIIDVSGTMRLVALGRRLDGAGSRTFAASAAWQDLIPMNQWTHLAATFNFNDGSMALYRNGVPLAGFYTAAGNSWGAGPTSATNPSGIKIGGSYPANTSEQNPFNGRFDELMFFNQTLSAADVAAQYALFANPVPEPATAALMLGGLALIAARRRAR